MSRCARSTRFLALSIVSAGFLYGPATQDRTARLVAGDTPQVVEPSAGSATTVVAGRYLRSSRGRTTESAVLSSTGRKIG